MDFEDIANAVWVGVIIVVAVLSGRNKRILGSDRKPSGNLDANKVRKPIKAPQRPCNTDAPPSPSHQSRSNVPLPPVKRNFSAYKHLPEQTTTEENIPDATVFLPETKAPVILGSVNSMQSDVAGKKTRLREWITGQIVLNTPAFRKNYGNFFNR